jgi:DNA (cytosine-5)-methyltransferase 1
VSTRLWVQVDNGLLRTEQVSQGRGRRFTGHAHPFAEITARPMPTITTRPVPVVVEQLPGGRPQRRAAPRVPQLEEIARLPRSGLTAVSTFSGCGGSCLGLRMAGYSVAWASEFVPAAADTYRANCDSATVLDTRDIRDVQPGDILAAAQLDVGQVDLMEGSPPCRSFSTGGKRQRGWGQVSHYSGGVEQRTDDLFFEFARLVDGVRPRVFVAENVTGLVVGTAKGYFKRILARLAEAGYRCEARVLDASWLGVPQARRRLIIIGVRDDLAAAPCFPAPRGPQARALDALGELDGALAVEPETGEQIALNRYGPSTYCRRLTLPELRALGGFPADFALTGSYAQRWERIGRAVPPPVMAAVAAGLRDRVLLERAA